MDDRARGKSRFALRFFFASAAVLCAGGLLADLLIRVTPPPSPAKGVSFPVAFWISTGLLFTGSVALQRALYHVRIERQRPFRRGLLTALAAGTAFVGVQCQGLWHVLQSQDPADVALGAGAFLGVLAVLHGLHFSVALLFLVYVTLQGLADRYDHEYYWGVTVCAVFWHVLGAAWLFILGVFAMATVA